MKHQLEGKRLGAADRNVLNGTVVAAIEIVEFTNIHKVIRAVEQQVRQSGNQNQMIIVVKL